MDGVGTPIIGRPRPLPGHDTPNPANNTSLSPPSIMKSRIGSTTGNHVEYRVVPYQAVSASRL